jgi:hypothetical protein
MAYFVAAALKNRYFLVLAKGKKEGKQAQIPSFFSFLGAPLGLGKKGNIDSLVSCCDREEEKLEESFQEALACSDSRKRERSGESLHVFEQSEAVGRRSSVVSGLLDQDGTTYLSALHPIKGCIVEEENVTAVLCAISTRPL